LIGIDYEIADFFHRVAKFCSVEVVKGNHDGNLERMCEVKVHGAGGIIIREEGKKYGLCHGHAWPSPALMGCDYLILSHNHPLVELVDKNGYMHREPVFLAGKIDAKKAEKEYGKGKVNSKLNAVVMPAFNPVLFGIAVNRNENQMLGPFFKNKIFKLLSAIVYRLNGTCLGEIKSLLLKPEEDFDGKKGKGKGKADKLRFLRKKDSKG
jgi:metallophosphoesterase superfamily enzyme